MKFERDERTANTRPKLRERAYDAFTSRLLTRELYPGQFISQRELVEITGLTLGAIRELVPRLEVEGLIRTVPKRGMQIAHIDLSLVRQAFQFRLFMERESIALYTTTASDDELVRWRQHHEDILARLGQEPTRKLLDDAQAIDWGFHDRIVDSVGNPILSQAYRVNSIKIRLIRREQTRLDDEMLEPAMFDHLRVIDALQRRDVAASQAALSDHIENARRRALGL